MKRDGERERKRDEKKTARRNSCGRERFNKRPSSPKCKAREPENETEEYEQRRSSKNGQIRVPIDPLGPVDTQQFKFPFRDQPLERNHRNRTKYGPEAVGAMAYGVAEGEIFTEGEDGDDGGGDGDDRSGSEEDQRDDDGDEDGGSGDAGPGHRGVKEMERVGMALGL